MRKFTQPILKPVEECKKRSYSYSEAHFTINQAKANHTDRHKRRKKIPQRAYKCELCHTWHLTSKRFNNHGYED